MKYAIKNFETEGNQKFVGFYITDDNGNTFAIDKRVPLQDGKTPEQYIADALALCELEIADWQASYAIVGKVFDPATGAIA